MNILRSLPEITKKYQRGDQVSSSFFTKSGFLNNLAFSANVKYLPDMSKKINFEKILL